MALVYSLTPVTMALLHPIYISHIIDSDSVDNRFDGLDIPSDASDHSRSSSASVTVRELMAELAAAWSVGVADATLDGMQSPLRRRAV